MAVLEEELERTSKYLKRWVKRFVSFNDKTCYMSYGTSKYRIKRSMLVTKVTRAAGPPQNLSSSTADPFAVLVEGVNENGEHQIWSIRMPDVHSFNLWFITLRNSLSQPGTFSSARFVSPSTPEKIAATIIPTSPSLYKDRLERFFQKYAPERITDVDKLLRENKGEEEVLFTKLSEEYCNLKPIIKKDGEPVALGDSSNVVQRTSISSVPEQGAELVFRSVEEESIASDELSDDFDVNLDDSEVDLDIDFDEI